MTWRQIIERHYREVWSTDGQICPFSAGPVHELPEEFSVMRYAPQVDRNMWTYATCCMSQPADERPIELHMFSPRESVEIVELLVVTAHYHRTGARLDLGHTVNFGRPWLDASECEHGLVSLPYLDGPSLENLNVLGKLAKFYWLLPVARSEIEFSKKHGLDALEQEFERVGVDYLNPERSIVR